MSRSDKSYIPGVPDKEVVATIHREFRGYDKYLHAKVKAPDKYGVMLTPEAQRIVDISFCSDILAELPERPDQPKPVNPALSVQTPLIMRQVDRHRFTRRAGCRLSDATADKLQQYVGPGCRFKTVNDLLNALIEGYITRQERSAARRPKTDPEPEI
jgi:hypothetical protein